MARLLATVKAVLTRLVFAAHGAVAIWLVTLFKRQPFLWYLSAPILLLGLEALFTLTVKRSQEWKWFCPSVFLYLASVVPAVWLLELDKVERRLRVQGRPPAADAAAAALNLSSVALSDLQQLRKLFGVEVALPSLPLDTDTGVTLVEQFLMLVLIVGRWMLPKGELTRDQLSQLLLVYIGTAADIIEFFDSFKDDTIAREPLLVNLTLAIWSWSLLQFTVVLTATKSRKSRLSAAAADAPSPASGKRSGLAAACCSIDVWGIVLNMLLQDAPFLAFRLLLIAHFRIVTYMNVFFTCKNTLVILLQLYRLYVVQAEAGQAQRAQQAASPGPGPPLALVLPPRPPQDRERRAGRRRSRSEPCTEASPRAKRGQRRCRRCRQDDTRHSAAASLHCSSSQVSCVAQSSLAADSLYRGDLCAQHGCGSQEGQLLGRQRDELAIRSGERRAEQAERERV